MHPITEYVQHMTPETLASYLFDLSINSVKADPNAALIVRNILEDLHPYWTADELHRIDVWLKNNGKVVNLNAGTIERI